MDYDYDEAARNKKIRGAALLIGAAFVAMMIAALAMALRQ